MEDDWTGTPQKMPACLSVNQFYGPHSEPFQRVTLHVLEIWKIYQRIVTRNRLGINSGV